MKRINLYAVLLLAVILAGCKTSSRESLRSGDLLFVQIPADYTLSDGSGLGFDSGALNIHVAILEVSASDTLIIDATIARGVARYPFRDFKKDFTLRDGSLPRMEVYRANVGKDLSENFVQNATSFLGQSYDVDFEYDNGALYCSELVDESFVFPDGSHLFAKGPITFRDSTGRIPQYWTDIFTLLCKDIPEGHMGIMPEEMMRSSALSRVGLLNLSGVISR